MDKLRINLIPPEVKAKSKKEAKRALISRISIGLLGLLIVITVGILSVIVYQNLVLQNLNKSIEENQAEISSLKDQEAIVFFLKNRIDSINKFAVTQYTQTQVFETITSLFPEGVRLTTLQIDKNPKISVQGETASSERLNAFLNNLTDPAINEGKIASVFVESLTKGPTGLIRFNLTIDLGEI